MEPGQRYCMRQPIDSRISADHIDHIIDGMTDRVGRELVPSLLNAGPVVVDMRLNVAGSNRGYGYGMQCYDVSIDVDLTAVQKKPNYYMHEMEPFAVHRDSQPDSPPWSFAGSLVDDFFDMWDEIPCSVITRTEV